MREFNDISWLSKLSVKSMMKWPRNGSRISMECSMMETTNSVWRYSPILQICRSISRNKCSRLSKPSPNSRVRQQQARNAYNRNPLRVGMELFTFSGKSPAFSKDRDFFGPIFDQEVWQEFDKQQSKPPNRDHDLDGEWVVVTFSLLPFPLSPDLRWFCCSYPSNSIRLYYLVASFRINCTRWYNASPPIRMFQIFRSVTTMITRRWQRCRRSCCHAIAIAASAVFAPCRS